jgi:hypothetical protein
LVQAQLIDTETTVTRVLTATDLITDQGLAGPEYARLRMLAMVFAQMQGAMDLPVVVQLSDTTDGYLPGAGVRFLDGQAEGRQLYNMSGAGNVLLLDGEGEASNLRLSGWARRRSMSNTTSPNCRRSWGYATPAASMARCCGSSTPSTRPYGRRRGSV